MFDNVEFTLASAVADAGTVTVGYPTGRSKGSYDLTTGKHKLFVNGNEYSAPEDFTLTFNANSSNITLTNAAGVTWAQSASCRLQIEKAGQNDGKLTPNAKALTQIAAGLYLINLGSPNVADTDGILDGVAAEDSAQSYDSDDFVSTFDGNLDVPRNITITGSAGANHVVTITGEDYLGNAMVEAITASGTNTIAGLKAFASVSAIDIAAGASGDTIDVGFGDVLGLPVALFKGAQVLAELEDGIAIGTGQLRRERLAFDLDTVDLLAGTSNAAELVAPYDCTIKGLTTIVRDAIGTGGTVTVNNVTTPVDGLTITVANSATKGTKQSDTPTAGHATTSLSKDDRIQIVPQDAFATSGALNGFLEIEPAANALTSGTLVLADGTEATSTTGDVRGTYDPETACDGDQSFALLVALPDPGDQGVAQYAG